MDGSHVPRELARLISREQAMLEALDAIEAAVPARPVRDALAGIRVDHAHRLSRYGVILDTIEGGPKEPSQQFGELVAEEVALVRNAQGMASALKRLLLVERANAAEYEVAQLISLPEGAHTIVRRAHEKEGRHIATLEGLAAAAEAGGAAAEGGRGRDTSPAAVPTLLPQSPTHRQLEHDIREDFPSKPPGFRK